MENPIKMDDLGVPLFLETPISSQQNQRSDVVSPGVICSKSKSRSKTHDAAGCIVLMMRQFVSSFWCLNVCSSCDVYISVMSHYEQLALRTQDPIKKRHIFPRLLGFGILKPLPKDARNTTMVCIFPRGLCWKSDP